MRFKRLSIFISFIICILSIARAQVFTSDSVFRLGLPNTGRFSSNIYFDYYYKSHADSLIRGGANQYTGVAQGKNAFAFRRIYLGYGYNISEKFTAEFLLSTEDNLYQTNRSGTGVYSGDLLSNGKPGFFVKLAFLKWKKIFKGSDLLVGQVTTPAFSIFPQKIWAYRSLEKTIADIRKTPSYDQGIALQGMISKELNIGYHVMIGNGTGARAENDKFKWLYGEVNALLFNKKLAVDIYADYNRMDWSPHFHHSRNMIKGFVAFNTPSLAFGSEAYLNFTKKDNTISTPGHIDTVNATSGNISFFVHGNIKKNKIRFVLRYDYFDPFIQSKNSPTNSTIRSFNANFEPSNKEKLIIAGIDFELQRSIHLIPNIWYTQYLSKLPGTTNTDHDMVYRLTLMYYFQSSIEKYFN